MIEWTTNEVMVPSMTRFANSMVFTMPEITSIVGSWMWPLMRIGAMVRTSPVFGGNNVSKRVQTLFAFALTIIMVPLIPSAPAVEPISVEAIIISMQQIAIGVAMGLILQMVFAAMVFGGHAISLSMGLGFSTMVDPQTGVNVPVLSQFFLIIATLLFLVMDGHLVLIQVMAESFKSMPVGMIGMDRNSYWLIASWASKMFVGGMMIAIPAMLAILTVNVAFGVMAKAAPQLNIFAVGFPITLLLGFIIVMITLPNVPPHLTDLLEQAFELIRLIIEQKITYSE